MLKSVGPGYSPFESVMLQHAARLSLLLDDASNASMYTIKRFVRKTAWVFGTASKHISWSVVLSTISGKDCVMHVQDERLQMAFSGANASESDVISHIMSKTPPHLYPSASQSQPDTPKLNCHRADPDLGAASAESPNSSASVMTVTKNLNNLGFGSPT